MRTQEIYTDYQDHFEYFGNTEIERIRMQGETVIKHDWIMFDSVDEAMEFFNDRCCEREGYIMYELVLSGKSDLSQINRSVDILWGLRVTQPAINMK